MEVSNEWFFKMLNDKIPAVATFEIEENKAYELRYNRCLCDLHIKGCVNTGSLCECSKQSLLYSKVDFISIAAYFELTNNSTNTVENLASAIESSQIAINGQVRHQNIKQEIRNFYEKWNKPIFFGELGFHKSNYSSYESWLIGFSVFAIGEQSSDKHYYPSQESTEVIKNWYTEKR